MNKELPKRKPTRLKNFDYNNAGVYFITICTENREQILSQIVGINAQSEKLRTVGVGVPDDPKNSDALQGNDIPKNNDNYDLFSENADVKLLPYGKIADKYIKQLNDFYDNIKVDQYVIMPNHIHILLIVYDDKILSNRASRTSESGASRTSLNGSSRTPTPTMARQNSVVSRFISTFKRFCNKEYGNNIWQRHFNDHIIRNNEDYEMHLRYIYDNPIRWHYDELYPRT